MANSQYFGRVISVTARDIFTETEKYEAYKIFDSCIKSLFK